MVREKGSEESTFSSRTPSSSGREEKQAGVSESRVKVDVCASVASSSRGDRKLHTCGSRTAGKWSSVGVGEKEAEAGEDDCEDEEVENEAGKDEAMVAA